MNNYDFYGNYDKAVDDSISVFEIHKKQKQKENYRLSIYKKIISRCYAKIKLAAESEKFFCFYQMPEYIVGCPIYNMTECLMFIINELSSKGYNCKYCHPLLIYISWTPVEKTLKLEHKKEEYNTNENKDLNFRSINDYKPSGNFIVNKNKKKTLFF